ncbi:hypothetical protein LSO2F_20070 [Candidatus Liberibacter solanacearum]
MFFLVQVTWICNLYHLGYQYVLCIDNNAEKFKINLQKLCTLRCEKKQ